MLYASRICSIEIPPIISILVSQDPDLFETYKFILIIDMNAPHLVFALIVWLRMHRCTNHQIVQFITVDIGHAHRIPEISADLFARDILLIGHIPREYQHFTQ